MNTGDKKVLCTRKLMGEKSKWNAQNSLDPFYNQSYNKVTPESITRAKDFESQKNLV